MPDTDIYWVPCPWDPICFIILLVITRLFCGRWQYFTWSSSSRVCWAICPSSWWSSRARVCTAPWTTISSPSPWRIFWSSSSVTLTSHRKTWQAEITSSLSRTKLTFTARLDCWLGLRLDIGSKHDWVCSRPESLMRFLENCYFISLQRFRLENVTLSQSHFDPSWRD